ncbi:hypothetical protein ACXYRK_04020 [Mycoplasma sp. AC1221]
MSTKKKLFWITTSVISAATTSAAVIFSINSNNENNFIPTKTNIFNDKGTGVKKDDESKMKDSKADIIKNPKNTENHKLPDLEPINKRLEVKFTTRKENLLAQISRTLQQQLVSYQANINNESSKDFLSEIHSNLVNLEPKNVDNLVKIWNKLITFINSTEVKTPQNLNDEIAKLKQEYNNLYKQEFEVFENIISKYNVIISLKYKEQQKLHSFPVVPDNPISDTKQKQPSDNKKINKITKKLHEENIKEFINEYLIFRTYNHLELLKNYKEQIFITLIKIIKQLDANDVILKQAIMLMKEISNNISKVADSKDADYKKKENAILVNLVQKHQEAFLFLQKINPIYSKIVKIINENQNPKEIDKIS